MDILNADLSLSQSMEKWKKSERNPKRKGPTTKKSKKQDEDDLAFHYIAYVPIKGEVWRLNGLERHPVNLGQSNITIFPGDAS
jgi:ubiquitin carboxyl-terminal hydrolase L5